MFLIPFSLLSCQSVKDGLSGRKSENSDEFLVQKKNPLVLPPDFKKLPTPDSSNDSEEQEDLGKDIEELLGIVDEEKDQQTEKIESSLSPSQNVSFINLYELLDCFAIVFRSDSLSFLIDTS